MGRVVLTQVRHDGCLVYWVPEDQALRWEDREHLIDMPSHTNRAFRRLVRAGADPSTVTNADLAEVIAGDQRLLSARREVE
jgi:hypothetical protein